MLSVSGISEDVNKAEDLGCQTIVIYLNSDPYLELASFFIHTLFFPNELFPLSASSRLKWKIQCH